MDLEVAPPVPAQGGPLPADRPGGAADLDLDPPGLGGTPRACPSTTAADRAAAWLAAVLRLAESLPAALLAIAILILAGPQKWDEPRSKRVLTNIEFCVDVSGSMTAKFEDRVTATTRRWRRSTTSSTTARATPSA